MNQQQQRQLSLRKTALKKLSFAQQTTKPFFRFLVIINCMKVSTCSFIKVFDLVNTNYWVVIISIILFKIRDFVMREIMKNSIYGTFSVFILVVCQLLLVVPLTFLMLISKLMIPVTLVNLKNFQSLLFLLTLFSDFTALNARFFFNEPPTLSSGPFP